MHQYFMYGLGLHSEIKLYSLEETEVKCDVKIHYGTISNEIALYTKEGLASTMSPSRVWFRNDIGHFVITGGDDILVQPIGEAGEEELASFILGWCIAFLFQQRNVTAIHSSAIEIGNQAILLSGFSGSGKSTTALSLIQTGCRYLADDIAMVNPREDMLLQPAFPQQKVCRNVAKQMDATKLIHVDEKKDKFAYYNFKDFCDEPRKLTTMFMLSSYDGDRVSIEKVTGVAKLNGVLKNLFLLDAYRAMGFTVEEKARCLEIAGKIDIYKISRPRVGETVEIVRDMILETVKGKFEGGKGHVSYMGCD